MKRFLVILLMAGLIAPGVSATPPPSLRFPGFLLLPEQRYDPAVQRYLAEQSLSIDALRDRTERRQDHPHRGAGSRQGWNQLIDRAAVRRVRRDR